MTKLRVSSHRLSIESGRWSKPNPTTLSERNCLFCNLLEDEYHFVLECNLYNTFGKLYLGIYSFLKMLYKFHSRTICQQITEQTT